MSNLPSPTRRGVLVQAVRTVLGAAVMVVFWVWQGSAAPRVTFVLLLTWAVARLATLWVRYRRTQMPDVIGGEGDLASSAT
jgi:hypothetical protein